MSGRRRPLAGLGAAALAAGCTVTPLTNKLDPGSDPMVLVVGEGRDGQTDLFAAAAAGGRFIRLTFTRPVEAAPALSPAGTAVAFVRARTPADTTAWDLVVLDLLTAGERSQPVPAGGLPVAALGWSPDGARLYLRGGGVVLATPAPPAALALAPVPDAERPRADSATRALLGAPAFAELARCGDEPCAVTAGGDTTRFGARTAGAFAWGADSIGLLRDGTIEVRPLGGGRTRRPDWSGAPDRLRMAAYHPGAPPGSPR
jgi:hypothetical protein